MKMNAKRLIATVAVFAATGSVFAQQTETVDPAANFVSTRTRAEVIAELKQARADGSLNYTDDRYPVVQANRSSKSREQTRAELVEAQRNHVINVTNSFGD